MVNHDYMAWVRGENMISMSLFPLQTNILYYITIIMSCFCAVGDGAQATSSHLRLSWTERLGQCGPTTLLGLQTTTDMQPISLIKETFSPCDFYRCAAEKKTNQGTFLLDCRKIEHTTPSNLDPLLLLSPTTSRSALGLLYNLLC